MKTKRWRDDTEAWKYGFRWGQVDCIRYAHHKGNKCLSIETDRQIVQVWVTPSGLIRVGKPTKQLKTLDRTLDGMGR